MLVGSRVVSTPDTAHWPALAASTNTTSANSFAHDDSAASTATATVRLLTCRTSPRMLAGRTDSEHFPAARSAIIFSSIRAPSA